MASIQGIYIALFGRPADPAGLRYFDNVTKGGTDLRAIGDLAGTQEYQDRFTGMSPTEIVTAIYKSLLGREPEAGGLAFWVEKLAGGSLNVNTIAIAVLDGAIATDRQTIEAKIAIADAFTASLNTPEKIAAYVGIEATKQIQSYLAGVSWDKPGSPADLQTIVEHLTAPATGAGGGGGTPIGLDVGLTTGDDHIVGTAAADKISGIIGGNNPTFGPNDTIDGGAGVDTFKLTLNGAATIDGTKVKSIENFVFSHELGSGTFFLVDLTSVDGVAQVALEDVPEGGGINLTTAKPVALVLRNTNGSIYSNSDLSGANDKLAITLDHAGTASAYSSISPGNWQIGSYESVSITSAGSATNYFALGNFEVANGSTLKIDGTAGLDIQFAGAMPLASINASSASGGVRLDLSSYGQSLSLPSLPAVTLGSGNDTVYVTTVNSGDTLNGGSGTDKLVIGTGGSDLSRVSNFEILRIENNVGFEQSVGTFKTIEFSGSNAQGMSADLVDLLNNSTVTMKGLVDDFRLTLANDSGANDSLTLILDGFGTMSGGTISAGLETLNIKTVQGTENNMSLDTSAKLVLSGAGSLSLSSAATVIDASDMTGNLDYGANGAGIDHAVTLGTGADTLALTYGGHDTVTLGKIGVNAQSGADRINLDANYSDKVVFVGSNNAVTDASTGYDGLARIHGFGLNGKLGFSAHDSDFRTLAASADESSAVTGLSKGAVAKGLASDDAFVVQSVDASQTLQATANVSLFKFLETAHAGGQTTVAEAMAGAIGGTSITGLAAGGNYLVSYYDADYVNDAGANGAAIIVVVNTGADTSLTASDFSSAGVSVVGAITMSSSDYASFGAANLVAV